MNKPALRVCEIEPATDVLPLRRWLFGLQDVAARNRIVMRIDYGQGYRVYYVRQGDLVVIFAGGGTKDGQQTDIEAVAKLWEQVENDVERYTRNFVP